MSCAFSVADKVVLALTGLGSAPALVSRGEGRPAYGPAFADQLAVFTGAGAIHAGSG